MIATAKVGQWVMALALTGTAFGAAAQAAGDSTGFWVENENFEITTCSTAGSPSYDQMAGTVDALRARAEIQMAEVLRASGVQLLDRQYLLLTPIEGALACGGRVSWITVRATAFDQRSNRRWTAEMVVGTDSIDRAAVSRLAGGLARQFGSTTVASIK